MKEVAVEIGMRVEERKKPSPPPPNLPPRVMTGEVIGNVYYECNHYRGCAKVPVRFDDGRVKDVALHLLNKEKTDESN